MKLARAIAGAAVLSGLFIVAALAQDQAAKDDKTPPPSKGLAGYWQGVLKVGPTSLRLGFQVKGKEGSYSATVNSPDQGATGLPVGEVKVEGAAVTFTMKKLAASYTGKLNDERTEIKGKWKQGGVELALDLKRLDKVPSFARPQQPKKPYPYREEEVVFENAKHNIELAGTLTLPKGEGPFSAAMLITGSGPQDRNETIFGHKPFLVLADYLTRKGIAVLRADDRGIGKSKGKFAGATSADFAEDIKAGVAFLRARKDIDPKRVGLIGHSEGGLIAPMIAVQDKELAFIVLLAGPGIPGHEISMLQVRHLMKTAGAKEATIADRLKLQRKLLDLMMADDSNEELSKKLKMYLQEEAAKLGDKEKSELAKQKAAIDAQLSPAGLPWQRFFLRHDPRPFLAKVECPVLALFGEKDFQVPPKDNLPGLEKALKEGGNKDFTVRELKGHNHLFQNCKTGGLEEYGAIEETLSPRLLELVSEWVLKRVKQ